MQEIEKVLWRKVFRYAKFLRFVPFLRMVAVCNSLSFGLVDEKSDIDLFVVARRGRLFMARIFLTGLFCLLGVRRHGKKVAGRFCLSFFVDEDFLDLSRIALQDDVYLAYWIGNLKLILDDGVGEKFFAANGWAGSYFQSDFVFDWIAPVDGFLKAGGRKSGNIFKKIMEWLLGGRFGNFIESVLKKWQLKRARLKKSRVKDQSGLLIDEHILKFHNVDMRREYRRLWTERFGGEKLTRERFGETACSLRIFL